jgi:hypothetical protein
MIDNTDVLKLIKIMKYNTDVLELIKIICIVFYHFNNSSL